jgi:hypothetical protein
VFKLLCDLLSVSCPSKICPPKANGAPKQDKGSSAIFFISHIYVLEILILPLFINIYSLYRGGICCGNSELPYIVHWLDCTLHLSPIPSSSHLKQLQKRSSFCFLQVHEAHQLYSLIFISSIQPSFLQALFSSILILQSSFSLSTTKSMFKGISQCIGAVKNALF